MHLPQTEGKMAVMESVLLYNMYKRKRSVFHKKLKVLRRTHGSKEEMKKRIAKGVDKGRRG